ncbi:hypothetical protein LJC34_01455 [Oscillospiraceae bacterium OttesenSCG-928-G22]|nr:hypothetical protein [Oscillospiraceae bacterium OttesenSCG-928-G22]
MRACVLRKLLPVVLFAALIAAAVALFFPLRPARAPLFAGGLLRARPEELLHKSVEALSQSAPSDEERFHRPSKRTPYPNSYQFANFREDGSLPAFARPEEVILAYYGILRDAANLEGYLGGCGTVGWASLPYPLAYTCLSADYRDAVSEEAFFDSFAGTGHITLLTLEPIGVAEVASETRYTYFVELECITAQKDTFLNDMQEAGTMFQYYYGIVTVVPEAGGYAISSLSYTPEDFLCAPFHGWAYDAEAIIGIVYTEQLQLVDWVSFSETSGVVTSYFCDGPGGKYRLDFVRLANGWDLLLRESILYDGRWVEAELLPQSWSYLKARP